MVTNLPPLPQPLPDVIESDLTFQSILDLLVSEVSAAVPDWTPSPADPLYAALGSAAFQIFQLRQDFNERVLGLLAPYATGQTLKDLAGFKGVVPEENESDDTLRQRVLTGWEAQVGTTLPSIESQARAASTMVRDVAARYATPPYNAANERLIELAVLSTAAETESTPPGLPAAGLLTEVADFMNEATRRFALVRFSAIQPTLTPYDVTARLHFDPQRLDQATALLQARASLDVFTEEQRFLGVAITLDRIEDALLVSGIDQVDLMAPAANLAAAETTAYHPGNISLSATPIS